MSLPRWLLRLSCAVSLGWCPQLGHAQQAEDHLQPVPNYFTSFNFQQAYYGKLREILYAGVTSPPLASVVVLPSFDAEYVLYVEKKADHFYLTFRSCQTSLWYAQYSNSHPPPVSSVPTSSKVVAVSPPLAQAIADVFRRAIAETTYPAPVEGQRREGNDGTTYVFGAGTTGGQTWSPDPATRMGMLVNLVTKLEQLVEAPSDPRRATLLQQAQQLADLFTKK